MGEYMLKGFDPEMNFEDGLRVQWKNRVKYMTENPMLATFYEQLRSSTYQDVVYETVMQNFKEAMGKFMHNAVKREEINAMPLEVYWSMAFAPLYNLIRFHNEGRSIGGRPFVLNNKIIWQTFDLVIKALKK